MSQPTEIEKESLEAHVELCGERYNTLRDKLDNLDSRMTKVEEVLVDLKNMLSNENRSRYKEMLGWSFGIIAFLATVVATLIYQFIR